LGLAIVKEIVEAHEALMTMSDAFDHQEGRPGLIVRVEFPKPT
jgi:nitrogen fixation/metabolism regulation signal transduction histidine kinase